MNQQHASATRHLQWCLLVLLACMLAAFSAGANAQSTSPPTAIAGASCDNPLPMKCPEDGCPTEMVIEQGPAINPENDRRYFLDFPCDLQPGEKVTFILSLHGGGSFGNWQRHYFPLLDYVDEYRLVVATPNAPPQRWDTVDDEHLQHIVNTVYEAFGEDTIERFWLAGHSQGSMTSRRLVCTDFFADRVDGYLSLSGGRVGGGTTRPPGGFFGTPEPGETAGIPQVSTDIPDCDFSFIYAIGQYEMGGPISVESPWADKYNCGVKEPQPWVVDSRAGYVYDSGRQDPGTRPWGLLPGPGSAEVWIYPDCDRDIVVADVVRHDKGHTEGLESNITETIVQLMVSAPRL